MSGFLDAALADAKADVKAKRLATSSDGKAAVSFNSKIKARRKGERQPMSEWLAAGKDKTKYNYNEAQSAALRLSEYDLERSRRALERKTKKYNQMYNRGTDMALKGDARESLMVDFDRKWAEGHRQESLSSGEDEDEAMIEIKDEFGRTRRIKESEALLHEPDEPSYAPVQVIRGPHLQTFVPDAAKKDEIWAELNREVQDVHYDPNFELRQRGNAFINLGDGGDRRERLRYLQEEREETRGAREKQGHYEREDLRPNFSDRLYRQNEKLREEQARQTARQNELAAKGEAFLDSLM